MLELMSAHAQDIYNECDSLREHIGLAPGLHQFRMGCAWPDVHVDAAHLPALGHTGDTVVLRHADAGKVRALRDDAPDILCGADIVFDMECRRQQQCMSLLAQLHVTLIARTQDSKTIVMKAANEDLMLAFSRFDMLTIGFRLGHLPLSVAYAGIARAFKDILTWMVAWDLTTPQEHAALLSLSRQSGTPWAILAPIHPSGATND